ncbi:LHFPL tetraspan subfamily member 6 protein-like [Lampetra planeri]
MAVSPGSMTSLGRVWALLSVVAAAACSVGYLLPFWLLGEQMGSEVSFGTFKRCSYPALVPGADGRLRVAMMNQCGRYSSWAAVPSPAWRGGCRGGGPG